VQHSDDAQTRIKRNIALVRAALASFAHLELVILFGSMAKGSETPASDLDVAVLANQRLTAGQRIELIDALALASGRPVDVVDLKTAGQPILNQILKYGARVQGSDEKMASLIYRNLVDRADFLPLRNRILKEKRAAWIST